MKNKLVFFKMSFLLILMISLVKCNSQKEKSVIKVINTRCENRIDPLGIDELNPHLSWNLESSSRNNKQSAYQILASNSIEMLIENKDILWDSKKVNSVQSIQI